MKKEVSRDNVDKTYEGNQTKARCIMSLRGRWGL